MSHINGFHPASSMMDHAVSDISKRRPSLGDTSTTSVSKRLKPNNVVSMTMNETPSVKGIPRKPKSLELKTKNLIQSDSNNNTDSIQPNQEHIPSTSSNEQQANRLVTNDYCHACGRDGGDMILCHICQAPFHLLCTNPSVNEEDIPKESYFCESCRTRRQVPEEKDRQQKLILPFRFTPKKNLQSNGVKKKQQHRSKLERVEVPLASNDQSVVQPSDETRLRATSKTSTKDEYSSASASHLKRKRTDSSPPPLLNSVPINDTQLDMLHRLLLCSQSEEFHGPETPSSKDSIFQKRCVTCRKFSVSQGPMIHCDYCPLAYHLDCLKPPLLSLPSPKEKWMCPNHLEPILDRYLSKKTHLSTSERVKIHRHYAQMKQNTIIQEFTERKPSKDHFFAATISNHRSELVNVSHIPTAIKEFYVHTTMKQEKNCETTNSDRENDFNAQTTIPCNEISSAYDPCVWDILQAILNHIVNEHTYEFSSIECVSAENDHPLTKSSSKHAYSTLDTIDVLLQALGEPNCTTEQCTESKPDSLHFLLTIPTSTEDETASIPLTNSFSLLTDLSQFRSSHAALIHLQSQHVIYIRKHVVWFGSSPLNDICITDFSQSHSCPYTSERHACLYYDRKRNLFELLNYSEYGTVVNDLRYGFDLDFNHDPKQENDRGHTCSCLTRSFDQPAWDGPAPIEQGTVIDIGCHQFLFYRHTVR